MAERTFDDLIRGHVEHIESLRSMMAVACDDWLDAFAPVLAEYWQAKAEEMVSVTAPEHTQELGAEGIKSLKAEVEKLAANARAEAEAIVVDGHRGWWPHLDEEVSNHHEKPYMSSGQFSVFRIHKGIDPNRKVEPGPSGLWPMMEQAFRRVEEPLKDAGYGIKYAIASRGTGSVRGKEYGWTGAMVAAMDRYADMHEEMIRTVRELEDTRKRKKETEAKNLWDQA